MTRRLVIGLLGGILLAAPAGCGIPDNTEVRVEGSGPAAEAGASSGGRLEPPIRTASDTREEFVENFLSAAAGEPDGAYDRVRQYIDTAHRARLPNKRGSEVALTVVRLLEQPGIVPGPDEIRVTLKVQQVGQLGADGVLAQPEATATSYEFGLRPSAQQPGDETDWFVIDPPPVPLLSVAALERYYQPRTIYFWSSDRRRLVPDQRYLPRAVPEDRRVSEVVRWLIGGPSSWLRKGASPLPDSPRLINNATRTDDRWEVNLDMPGDDSTRLELLGTQLAWSLPEPSGQLELKVRNQSRLTIDVAQRRQALPVYLFGGEAPQPFCVYEGGVHPLKYPAQADGSVPVAAAANTRVVSAGFSRSGRQILAALVVSGRNGRQHLSVGRGVEPISSFDTSAQSFKKIGRPVWLRSADPQAQTGLVVADGELYRFDAEAKLTKVQLSVPRGVTGVAASLDGHRLAVVAGDGLYVVSLNHDGGGLAFGQPRLVPTSLTGLTAVDWYSENSLVVAGSKGQPALYEIGVDGVRESELVRATGATVTHLSTYPANPADPAAQYGMVMYEANRVAYRGFPSERIAREQVGEVDPPPSGESPGNPTAPFFLY